MAVISPSPKLQFFDAAGNPLVGGKLYTYRAGTSTPQATFTDSTAATQNTNPIILDARGECSVWLDGYDTKFVLRDAADSLIWSQDHIGENMTQLRADLAASSGAALVGFSQSGAAPLAGTVAAKMRERISVKDKPYLAAGDGVNDDTAAIQAAVNAAGLFGVVYFPEGTYRITSAIVCNDQFIEFVGAGKSVTTILYDPASAGIAFDLRHTAANARSFSFRHMAITTALAAAGTAIKISVNLTAASTQVNGQSDSLYLDNVRIVQSGSGYWKTFIHSLNNGGIHLNAVSLDNNVTAAQSDTAVIGINLEVDDSRVSTIRSIAADDFYILRTSVAISLKSFDSAKPIESVYFSNGEIVGAYSAAIKIEGSTAALGFDNIHFDMNSSVLNASSGNVAIARFVGCDFRKGCIGGFPAVNSPMFLIDGGELISFSACEFSGSNAISASALNRAFLISNSATGQAVNRMSITGCSFRNFYSVFSPSLNCKISTSGNTYNVIASTVLEDNPLDNSISVREAFVSKTVTVALNSSGSQSISVAVPAGYFSTSWTVAVLQPSLNTGAEVISTIYDFDASSASSCVFIVKGNTTARTMRFAFLASGTVENVVAT